MRGGKQSKAEDVFRLPVVVDAATHRRVGLDAADEVARRAQQGRVKVLHGTEESLRHSRLHQGLQREEASTTDSNV